VNTIPELMSSSDECGYELQYEILDEPERQPRELPTSWSATAVLHPFSPPPENEPKPPVPFFQLCTAQIDYFRGKYLAAQITGCEYGTWWYTVNNDMTMLSVDQGRTWSPVHLGWALPSSNWFGNQKPTCAGTSYINWMRAQLVDWWKIPVENSMATTWMWFNAATGLPFRLMFGQPPPRPTMGDPAQLALFQMFSFTYFASFAASEPAGATAPPTTPAAPALPTTAEAPAAPAPPAEWSQASIPGFAPGNPHDYELVEWNWNFGMTTLMTPVDAASDPLPTRVLYRWSADAAYKQLTDRAQSTLMWYYANPQAKLFSETALLFGSAPPGVQPPPYSGSGFLIDDHQDGSVTCAPMPFAEQPPWWARIPEVEGTIRACVIDNPALCPGQTVTIISVLFPPSTEYPQGRYLWTWYALLQDSNGRYARPVTFMEAASTIAEGGTSLALADYFDYIEMTTAIEPKCFAIPPACIHTSG
jgi:hypothetical protein